MAASTALEFQVGEASGNTIASNTAQSNNLGLSLAVLKGITSITAASSGAWMAKVDTALTRVNTTRSNFGSTQNQLDSAIRNMMTQQTNIKAAESVIRDVDYAKESANFNKQNIVAQAGTYAMSQANAIQQNVLRLLQ